MIKLYTDGDKAPTQQVITFIDEKFNSSVRAKMLDNECVALLQKLDNAVIVDVERSRIQTPFGIGQLSDISTGTKVAIIVYLVGVGVLKPATVDVTECGINAMSVAFDLADRYSVPLILHTPIDELGDREVLINDKYLVHTQFALFDTLWDILVEMEG